MAPYAPVIIWKVKYQRCFNASYVQLIIQQYESTTVWKESLQSKYPLWKLLHYEWKSLHYEWKPSHTYRINTFKDEWNTKEGTDKSIKNTLYVQQYGKRHLLGWTNFEQQKIKPIALASYASLKASVSRVETSVK